MTVCTASIFMFNNGGLGDESDYSPAIVAASDRMWTDEGIRIQYEGRLKKRVRLGRTWALVAGAVSVHSAIIHRLEPIRGRARELSTPEIANQYAAALTAYANERAEQLILAPYKMTYERLVQDDTELTRDLRAKVENFPSTIEVEVLLMGVDGDRPYLISINRYGLQTIHDNIGFAAIGYGDIHAAAHFMQAGYGHLDPYFTALWRTFCAKKRAEVAPGVGKETDLMVITRDRVFDVPEATKKRLEELYKRLQKARADQDKKFISQLEGANAGELIWEFSIDNRVAKADGKAISDGSSGEISEDDSGGAKDAPDEPAGPQGPTGRSQRAVAKEKA